MVLLEPWLSVILLVSRTLGGISSSKIFFYPKIVILWLISHRMMKRYYPLSLYHGKFKSRLNSTITIGPWLCVKEESED
jgi:hypothetical protein